MNKNAQLILNIVNSSNEHLTAEEIFLKLKKLNVRMVLATVYNNLKVLYEGGLIAKVSVEGCPDRYDRIIKHDHLVCQKCGRLSDITLTDLTESLKLQIGEDILSYDLKVLYICPACKQIHKES